MIVQSAKDISSNSSINFDIITAVSDHSISSSQTLIDIHKVKQADKIKRLATVLEDANDAITVRDFEGRILAWNKGAEKIYWCSELEALKMNFSDFVPGEKKKEFRNLKDKIKKGEPLTPFKTQRKTKAGDNQESNVGLFGGFHNLGRRIIFTCKVRAGCLSGDPRHRQRHKRAQTGRRRTRKDDLPIAGGA